MSDRTRLIDLVQKLPGARVACVGDVMLDRFIYGSVDRISPEGPIPVLCIERETAMLGGAGNVVRNLVALGAGGAFVTAGGDDDTNGEIQNQLDSLPEIKSTLAIETGRPTAIKTRYIAAGQQLMRTDRETTDELSPETAMVVLDAVRDAIEGCAVVVVSDYGKGVLSRDITAAIIKAAKKDGKPVIVDPKGDDYSRYQRADLITPNLRELGDATAMDVAGDDAVVAAARSLIADHDFGAVLVTRSADGMTLVAGTDTPVHLPAEGLEIFDVSGAGDTVVATLAAAISVGANITDAARLANVAAGIVVGKVGTATVYGADITAALHHQDLSSADAKVMEQGPAIDRIATWRARGLRIGFTNGCFDLLHPGHVALMARARGACDRLVVGLNSDASITRLKGAGRPIQSEAARAAVLASLEAVDLVVIFSEDTPVKLIHAFRPDVLIKGADYEKSQVVGGEFVEGYGGKIVLVPLEEGHSTTATIARIGN